MTGYNELDDMRRRLAQISEDYRIMREELRLIRDEQRMVLHRRLDNIQNQLDDIMKYLLAKIAEGAKREGAERATESDDD